MPCTKKDLPASVVNHVLVQSILEKMYVLEDGGGKIQIQKNADFIVNKVTDRVYKKVNKRIHINIAIHVNYYYQ